MAVVGHELPGRFQDINLSRRRLFKHSQVVEQINPLLAQRIEDKALLEKSPVKDAVTVLAASLPRAKVSISKPDAKPDNPMNIVVSFKPKLSVRGFEYTWKSVVVGVVRDNQGNLTDDLNINSKTVPKDTDGEELMAVLKSAASVPFPAVWSMPDHPHDFIKERLRVGRTRINPRKISR